MLVNKTMGHVTKSMASVKSGPCNEYPWPVYKWAMKDSYIIFAEGEAKLFL